MDVLAQGIQYYDQIDISVNKVTLNIVPFQYVSMSKSSINVSKKSAYVLMIIQIANDYTVR